MSDATDRPLSRREWIRLSTALTAAGWPAAALARQPGRIKVAELPAAQRALLARPTLLPFDGRLPRPGVLTAAARNPELPAGKEGDGRNPNFDQKGGHRHPDDRKPEFDVYLLCRTFVGDGGFRPLPNGLCFWESPDVWIEGPTGDPDSAQVGVENKVKVHVWNLGLADCWGAEVTLYWCNPSVGVNLAAARQDGIEPKVQTVSLMTGEHKVVEFTWTPVLENGGHECLVAHVTDPFLDPLTAPFNPVQDRHVGQRNVSVVGVPAGKKVSMGFFAPNLSPRAAEVVLELERLDGPSLKVMAMGLGRAGLTAAPVGPVVVVPLGEHDAKPALSVAGLPAGTVFRETLQTGRATKDWNALAAALRMQAAPGKRRADTKKAAPPPRTPVAPDTGKGNTRQEVKLGAGRQAQFALAAEVPAQAKAGTAQVYRVVERVGDRITGGVTLVLVTR